MTLPPPTLKGDGRFRHSCPCGAVYSLTSKRLASECDELRKMFESLQADENENKGILGGGVPMECAACGEVLGETWCRRCGWDPEEPAITLGETRQITNELHNRTVDPADVCRLLKAFCECVERGKAPPAEIINYLSTAFRIYLDGTRKLEIALGLKRARGTHPKIDPAAQLRRAMEILLFRLKGLTHEVALDETERLLGYGLTAIGDAWRARKLDALQELCALRIIFEKSWAPDEVARLNKIYADDRNALSLMNRLTPGKTPTWPV